MLLMQLGALGPKFGENYEFKAIAATVLGGTSLFGGRSGRSLNGGSARTDLRLCFGPGAQSITSCVPPFCSGLCC
jgi:hypothetical protein